MGAFHFVVLSRLRAAQLMRGCIPKIARDHHKAMVVAQLEVASGKIASLWNTPDAAASPAAVDASDGASLVPVNPES